MRIYDHGRDVHHHITSLDMKRCTSSHHIVGHEEMYIPTLDMKRCTSSHHIVGHEEMYITSLDMKRCTSQRWT